MRCSDCLYYREDEDGVVRCYFPEGYGSRPCDKARTLPEWEEPPEDDDLRVGYIRNADYWEDTDEGYYI